MTSVLKYAPPYQIAAAFGYIALEERNQRHLCV